MLVGEFIEAVAHTPEIRGLRPNLLCCRVRHKRTNVSSDENYFVFWRQRNFCCRPATSTTTTTIRWCNSIWIVPFGEWHRECHFRAKNPKEKKERKLVFVLGWLLFWRAKAPQIKLIFFIWSKLNTKRMRRMYARECDAGKTLKTTWIAKFSNESGTDEAAVESSEDGEEWWE